jgi:hypothetical protein
MWWDGVGMQWSRFQGMRTGITWLPVLRAASRVIRKPLPGRAILPPIPQLLRYIEDTSRQNVAQLRDRFRLDNVAGGTRVRKTEAFDATLH